MARPNDDLIGKRLGQYEIIDEIGRGGMATVYRARQSSINRMIAIKVLPPQFMHDPSFFERFKREVDVIAHLEHPHILPIYDYGEVNGLPFIAIRYLGGGSLSDRLVAGPTPLEALEKPLAQIADALDHAHREGVIHRDLKPANILLDEHNNAYLTDFGIARVLNSNLTGSAIIGTPAYMSPEQAHGIQVDGRSDIYSLGVVLFQMVTGREPYEAPTPVALLLKHINEPMPLARELRPDTPPAVDDVIQKATAKSPDARFQTATALADAFRAAIRDEPVDWITAALPVDGNAATMIEMPPTHANAPTDELAAEASAAPVRTPRRFSFPVMALLVVAALLAVAMFLSTVVLPLAMVLIRPDFFPQPQPTPFAGAHLVDAGLYRLAIPDDWELVEDFSEADGRQIVWEDGDAAGLRLSVFNAEVTDVASFEALAETHSDTIYRANPDFTLIDEAVAPDGTLRRSYVVRGDETRPYGQTDVFYLHRASQLVVVEMFTSEASGNTYVPVLQNILDSLRVQVGEAA